MDDLDRNIRRLLVWMWRRLVGEKGIAGLGLAPLGLCGDLLPCRPLPLLAGMDAVVVLGVAGSRGQRVERRGCGCVHGRSGPIAGNGRLGRCAVAVGSLRVRADVGIVIDRVVVGWLVVSLALLGDVSGSAGGGCVATDD